MSQFEKLVDRWGFKILADPLSEVYKDLEQADAISIRVFAVWIHEMEGDIAAVKERLNEREELEARHEDVTDE